LERPNALLSNAWEGKATITVRDDAVNESTGRTEPVERVTASDLACRISFVTVKSTELDEEAARMVQTVTLYIDPSPAL